MGHPIAPIVSAIAMAFFVYLAISNFSTLIGSTSHYLKYLWVLVPLAAIVGYAMRSRPAEPSADAILPVAAEEDF
jgi:hypothetical protein